jgi:RNA-binding protein YlmH
MHTETPHLIGTYSTQVTPFLTPLECDAVYQTFKDLVDLKVSFNGGYPQAQRRVALFTKNEEYLDGIDDNNDCLTAISILGNFIFDKPSQADYIEALLNCGIKERIAYNQIGDIVILPGDKGAHVIFRQADDLAPQIQLALKQVRSVPVSVEILPDLASVYHRPSAVKEMTCVEASVRLDAVASGALGISRAKMVKLIESGEVTVNFKPMNNPAYSLIAGQEISIKDFGRLVIHEVSTTAKSKYVVIPTYIPTTTSSQYNTNVRIRFRVKLTRYS